MKNTKIIILIILFSLIFSTVCVAGIKTVYPTDEPTLIRTKLDTHTFISFKTSIVTAAVGNHELYSAATDNLTNKVKITPLKYGAFTNLIVFTSDGGQYEFWLEEIGDQIDFDGIVNIGTRPNIQIADLISMINKRKVSIDPAIKNLVKFYEITEPTYTVYENLNIYLKRAATVSNINQTIYWLRIENLSNHTLTLPDIEKDKKEIKGDEYCIPLSTIQVKDRLTGWVAVEANKERILYGDFTDLYLVTHGDYIDPSLPLIFNCNNKNVEVRINNIPYSKQDFRVFVVEDSNYTSVSIEDYWR